MSGLIALQERLAAVREIEALLHPGHPDAVAVVKIYGAAIERALALVEPDYQSAAEETAEEETAEEETAEEKTAAAPRAPIPPPPRTISGDLHGRDKEIVGRAWRNESDAEIARAVGSTEGAIGVRFSELRKRGVDIPTQRERAARRSAS
jgi:hypothetical protein